MYVHVCGGQGLNRMSSLVVFRLFTEAGSLAYPLLNTCFPAVIPFLVLWHVPVLTLL